MLPVNASLNCIPEIEIERVEAGADFVLQFGDGRQDFVGLPLNASLNRVPEIKIEGG